jgi:3-isopropylmalate/(R)-2-methylmalate dehydratase small subunit
VSCIIAETFARIFFRNAINIGLPILACPEAVAGAEKGDALTVDLEAGTITNARTGQIYHTSPFPPFIMGIIQAGGLVPYTRKRLQQK